MFLRTVKSQQCLFIVWDDINDRWWVKTPLSFKISSDEFAWHLFKLKTSSCRVNTNCSSHKASYGFYTLIAQLKNSRRKNDLALCISCEQPLHEASFKCFANMQSEESRQSKSSYGELQCTLGTTSGSQCMTRETRRYFRSKTRWPQPFTNKLAPLSD